VTGADVARPRQAVTKRRIEDLALLGGPRSFAEPLHVGRPNIGDRTRLFARLDEMLDRRILTNDGPFVEQLEARLAAITGARHVIAVVNATVGLEIAARAAGVTGEVIMPAFTFVATPHAMSWIGLEPVFCDIDPETLTLDPDQVASLIGPRTKAILGVHVYGRACEVERLERLAEEHGLALLFDAAHALGTTRDGRSVGTFGDAEVFSFHATKFVNAFEGGAIATNDAALAAQARLMHNFGISDWDRTAMAGTNGKMHEASAIMGLTSLDEFDGIVASNRANARLYEAGLAGIPGIRLVGADIRDTTAAQYAIIRVDAEATGLTRDTIQAVLVAEGILARRYFYPGCHRLEPYATQVSVRRGDLSVTDHVASEVLALPTGTSIGSAEVDAICGVIRFAVEHSASLADAVPGRA
jgi:dTDP-4-amino-4,6-dideoxygalactose transaminase